MGKHRVCERLDQMAVKAVASLARGEGLLGTV